MLRRVIAAAFLPRWRTTMTFTTTSKQNNSSTPPPNHPTIDKIIKSEDASSLEGALVELSGLSEKNRELALKLALNKVFSAKLPLSVLNSEKLTFYLSKHPAMLLEALLFKIKELMKSLGQGKQQQQVFDAINDNFVKCFSSLKQIKDSSLTTKYQVMLHKRFADYNLLYLSKCVQKDLRTQVLEKSRDFYHSALTKMPLLIAEEQDRLKKLTEQHPEGERSQEEDLKINALRENIRLLVETNAENVLHLFMTEKELTGREEEKIVEKRLPEKVLALLPHFHRALDFYQMFKKMTPYSIFYHRLKKLSLEINYYSKMMALSLRKASPEETRKQDTLLWGELLTELDALHKETEEDMKQIAGQPNRMAGLQEMALLLLHIRLHKTIRQQLSSSQFKQQLLEEVGATLDQLPAQDKKPIAAYLGRTVKQLLEEHPKQ